MSKARRPGLWIGLSLFLFIWWVENARANQGDALICDLAAARAAKNSGVPVAVLRAISLTETGRMRNGAFDSWPWTVNMEGKGVWFDTPSEALDYAQKNFGRGARSFDVGCFQINYKWHGQAFDSIADMFDPDQNAAYAAKFLTELYEEFGDWSKAAGAYHSRTPKFANRYAKRFERILSNLDDLVLPGPKEPQPQRIADFAGPTPRVNSFPLLQFNAGQASAGSLVSLPRDSTGRAPLIETASQRRSLIN